MLAKYILASLAVVFLLAAATRMMGQHGWSHPQVRTFLLISGIFTVVSAWLFYQQ
jgi:uncharacterized membrane protein